MAEIFPARSSAQHPTHPTAIFMKSCFGRAWGKITPCLFKIKFTLTFVAITINTCVSYRQLHQADLWAAGPCLVPVPPSGHRGRERLIVIERLTGARRSAGYFTYAALAFPKWVLRSSDSTRCYWVLGQRKLHVQLSLQMLSS